MQLVQISFLTPLTFAHWRLGYFLDQFTGLYFPRSFFRAPTILEPLPQIVQCLIGLNLIELRIKNRAQSRFCKSPHPCESAGDYCLPPAAAYSILTFSFFVFLRSSLGMRTVSTPFLKVTVELSGSTSWGKITDRENRPQ